jgi:hypothetical protein
VGELTFRATQAAKAVVQKAAKAVVQKAVPNTGQALKVQSQVTLHSTPYTLRSAP